MTIRLAHFVTHPIQYFAPLYRRLAAEPGVELTVLFGPDFGLRPSFDEGFGRTDPVRRSAARRLRAPLFDEPGFGRAGARYGNFDCPDADAVLRAGRACTMPVTARVPWRPGEVPC